jgi:hypothetical protein
MGHTEDNQLHMNEIAPVKCRLFGITIRREKTIKHTQRKFPQRQILSSYQTGLNLSFLTSSRFPLVSQAHIPGPNAAVVEADHQEIYGLPVGVDDDSR